MRSPSFGAPGAAISTGGTIPTNTVAERLEEIFEIQDRAVRDRDEALLRSVFAAECPCLEAGTDRIRRLREDGLRWIGYRSRVSDVHVHGSAAGTLTVSALVSGARTRVETESHELLRIIPAGSARWTFVLIRPPGGPLLLRDGEIAS